ncbi:MAG TPA: hypothetical protein VH186_08555 [Chloroflexia bacterium]|nr:hypothetical protein [Chloroflexia bacterium]
MTRINGTPESSGNQSISSGELNPAGRVRASRKLRWIVLGSLVAIVTGVTGILAFILLTTGGSLNSPKIPSQTSSPPAAILAGPPDQQVDLSYPGAIPLSLAGLQPIETKTTGQNQAGLSLMRGAFATTANLQTLENFYSQKLQAAGYKWDWEDACGPGSDTKCPHSRYFTAGIFNCVQTVNSNQDCSATYQINFWIVGSLAQPAEYQGMSIPQGIIEQLKPGQTLVTYSAGPLNNSTANTAGVNTTTAALVPSPTATRSPEPAISIDPAKLFVGPDNAFHYSQFDNNPDKQQTSGVSLVTTESSKPVRLGSDGTFQLDWLISEEGQKMSLQATVVSPHNTEYTASQLFNATFAYLSDSQKHRMPVMLVNTRPVEGAPNTFIWTMEANPLLSTKGKFTFNFEAGSGISLEDPVKVNLVSYSEAGLAHPVRLDAQGGQANGLWIKPLYAYFGQDRTIVSLDIKPDTFKDKEAYYLMPYLMDASNLKVTDDRGRVLQPFYPGKINSLTNLVLKPVAADARSLKVELAGLQVGHNLNQPGTSLEKAPVTLLDIPVGELLQSGQPKAGKVVKTPGIGKVSIEDMSAVLDPSGQFVTLKLHYRLSENLAYPPKLIPQLVGFSCARCGQNSAQNPVTTLLLPDGRVEFSLTYKYDKAQSVAQLAVVNEQFLLPGPWQFEIGLNR